MMEQEKEVWKPVKGYEGYYVVSNFGNVKSEARKVTRVRRRDGVSIDIHLKGKDISKWYDSRGYYLYVTLAKEGENKHRSVHSLVANAFLPKGEQHTQINHISGIKTDNRVVNLEFCTISENMKHFHKINPDYIMIASNKLTEKDVLKIREIYKTTNILQKDIAALYGLTLGSINRIVKRRTWKHI